MTLLTVGTKKKFGIEDLEIGEGTLQQTRNGAQTTITKVGAHSIPYNDSSTIKVEIDSKLFKSDVVDDLASTDTDKALSANQGRILNSATATAAAAATAAAGGDWTTIFSTASAASGHLAFVDDPQGNDYNFTDFNELLIKGVSSTDNCNTYLRIPTNLIITSNANASSTTYSYGLYDSANRVIFHFRDPL